MPQSEHGISAADVLNETARILEAPIETDPLRELRVVLNARLQTHAVQQDRAIRAGRLAAERFHEGAVTGLTYAIEQIDAWLAVLRLAASPRRTPGGAGRVPRAAGARLQGRTGEGEEAGGPSAGRRQP